MPVQRRGMHALQIWCSRVTSGYKNVDVKDLTTSFSDGLAFCAIIHHFRPDLIDFHSLNSSDSLSNCALAFRVAEEKLEIPALLDPEDMSDPDKFSVVTYLSQFYHLFKDEDSSCTGVSSSPRLSSARTASESEADSLLSASSSGASTPTAVGTPKGTIRGMTTSAATTPVSKRPVFNQAELIAKYGEEIFSSSDKQKNKDSTVEDSLASDLMSKARVTALR